jgi:dihydroxyacetone kinase-like predicted kinase
MVLLDVNLLFPDAQKKFPKNLSGKLLRNMLLNSFKKLEEYHELLNDVNVFPVPDGDTGFNMLQTFQSIVKEIMNLYDEDHFGVMISVAAKGAFFGCVGNSGIILSEYFQGLEKVWKEHKQINSKIFAEGLLIASEMAYHSVKRPREGTILTIAKEIAKIAMELHSKVKNLFELLFLIFERAKSALLETHRILPEANRAGVVDAGALGLVLIFEGFIESFLDEEVCRKKLVLTVDDDLAPFLRPKIDSNTVEPEFELILYIKELKKPLDYIKADLMNEGNCLLIVSDESSPDIKIHIHCPNPQRVISKLNESTGYLSLISVQALQEQFKNFLDRVKLLDKVV